MSLADMGIEMSELFVWRHIQTYPASSCCAERHRGQLDLQVPLHIAQADTRNNLIDLRSLLLECSSRLKSNEQEGEQTHGDFKIRKVSPLPADELHAATTAQLILKTDQYIRSLCLENGEPPMPLGEAEIEISSKPTLQIGFSSWMVFNVTVKVPDGVIDLSISYPDHYDNGRRPIYEIDTFLTALLAECRGMHSTNPSFMDSGEMRHSARDPELELPEHYSSVIFQGWKYDRIGGGYDFNQSWLQLIQRKGHSYIHQCLHPVLQEFRAQLVEQVPSLHN